MNMVVVIPVILVNVQLVFVHKTLALLNVLILIKAHKKIVDYVLAFDQELRKLMAPIGNSSLPIGRSDALVSTDKAIAEKLGIQYVC